MARHLNDERDTHVYSGCLRIVFAGDPDAREAWRRDAYIRVERYGPYGSAGAAAFVAGYERNRRLRGRDAGLYQITTRTERSPLVWERKVPASWQPVSSA